MILVLSDIHIGRHKSNWRKAVELMSQQVFDKELRQWVPKWKKIIVCGDFIDLWYRSEAMMALFALAIWNDIFNRMIYVTGNHDEDVLDILQGCTSSLQVRDKYYVKVKDKTYMFLHGHQADFFNSTIPWVGKFLTKVHAWVYRVFRWDIQHTIRGKLGRLYLDRQRKRLVERAKEMTNRPFQGLISGHTHAPGHWLVDNAQIEHYNTGDWVRNNTYLVIEENGTVLQGKM